MVGSLSGATCTRAHGSREIRSVARRATVLLSGTLPVPARHRIDVEPLVQCALALPRAPSRATAPHNETLQLSGADFEEVVVAATLARTRASAASFR